MHSRLLLASRCSVLPRASTLLPAPTVADTIPSIPFSCLTARQQHHFLHLHHVLQRALLYPPLTRAPGLPPDQGFVAADASTDGMDELRWQPSRKKERSRKMSTAQQLASHSTDTSRAIYVACGAHISPSSFPSCSMMPQPSFVTGVNFSVYRRCHPSPSFALKGLLRGCAEQNCLSAVAAGGMNYAMDVDELYILAMDSNRVEGKAMGSASCSGRHSLQLSRTAIVPYYPCQACWHYMARVGAMRIALQLPPLRVWVMVTSPSDAALPCRDAPRIQQGCDGVELRAVWPASCDGRGA